MLFSRSRYRDENYMLDESDKMSSRMKHCSFKREQPTRKLSMRCMKKTKGQRYQNAAQEITKAVKAITTTTMQQAVKKAQRERKRSQPSKRNPEKSRDKVVSLELAQF